MRTFLALGLVCVLTVFIWQTRGEDADLAWWKTAVFYQIYPRSYKDSDGNGVGDLEGIRSKINYFKELGVDCIWLSPICPSPMKDFGYDQSDYEDIEPLFGTLEDFDNLVSDIHANGLRIILDFVPSYNSIDHIWFQKSVRREGKYANYYIWHDGILLPNGTRTEPSNWRSVFGGSAWAWNEERQQYFYFSFTSAQPNLNHRDPNVEWEMQSIIRFWLDRGADGFRVDAIQQLFVSANLTANEPLSGLENVSSYEYDYNIHLYSADQPETVAAVTAYHDVLDEYYKKDGKIRYMVIESYATIDIRNTLYATGGSPFNFDLVQLKSDPTGFDVRDKIMHVYDQLPAGKWPNFVLGNHDQRRISHRYGHQYVDAFNMLLLTLWCTPTTYQGEELGMLEGVISWEQTQDPWGLNFGPDGYAAVSRDPERTPMQWDDGYQAGFTTGNTTWLPLGVNYTVFNVKTETESQTPTSIQLYKQLIRLRKRQAFQTGPFKLAEVNANIFSYIREGIGEKFLVALNVGKQASTTDYTVHVGEPQATIIALTPGVQGKTENQTVPLKDLALNPGEGLVLRVAIDSGVITG